MDTLDVVKDIPEEELLKERPEPKWRKPLIIIGGVILAVLVFSLSFSYQLQELIPSEATDDNMLVFPNATIVFSNNTLAQLQNEFITNEHREIKACLFGERDGALYNIQRVEFPKVISASVSHIAAIPCPIDTLVDLHSHPINQCLASGHDVTIHSKRRTSNEQLRMMIMCSSTRFALI